MTDDESLTRQPAEQFDSLDMLGRLEDPALLAFCELVFLNGVATGAATALHGVVGAPQEVAHMTAQRIAATMCCSPHSRLQMRQVIQGGAAGAEFTRVVDSRTGEHRELCGDGCIRDPGHSGPHYGHGGVS